MNILRTFHSEKMNDLFKHNLGLRDSFWNVGRDQLLLDWIKEGPVLDVGCGAGIMTEILMNKGFDTYSIDIEKRACDYTKKINPKTWCVDIAEFNEKEFPKFKTVIVLDVLEHVKRDELALRKIFNALDPGGRLVISVPYLNLLWNKTDKYHERRYSRRELRENLEDSGFVVEKMRLWNTLSLVPLILSKLLNFELSHRRIANSPLNKVLSWYFLNIENKISVPIGSQLFCLAIKKGKN